MSRATKVLRILMFEPIKQQILGELAKGDRLWTQLKNGIKTERDADLWTAIAQLEQEGLIKHSIVHTPPSASIAYTLVKQGSKAA